MSNLFAAGCSIVPTRRRRFLWAAWWTAPPERVPFRPPDAFEGGAKSREEALARATAAAGVALVELEPAWARAWMRIREGLPPWPRRPAAGDGERHARRGGSATASAAPSTPGARSVWSILGLPGAASADEIKRAYRRRALETHPDRGGQAEEFLGVQRAYEEALRRSTRPPRRRR